MKAVGIRRVYYSVDGKMICEKVNDMVSICSSSVLRMVERQVYNAPSSNLEYFKRLLNQKMPNILNKTNFYNFTEYNLPYVLPEFSWKKSKNKVYIFDEKKNVFKIIILI